MAGATSPTQQADALRALRARFRATSSNTVDAFRRLARHLTAAPDAPEVIEALRRELHRVHGTAGSYGFIEASRLAAKVEQRVLGWAAAPARERDQRAMIIEHFASALALAFEQGTDTAPETGARRAIAFVGIAPASEQTLRAEAALRGWRPAVIDRGAVLDAALASLQPSVVVTGVTGAAEVARAAADARAGCIVVVDSGAGERSEVDAAASAGGVLEIDDSAGAGAVIDAAERLALRTTFSGATVLVVDDDDSILAMVRYILESDAVRIVTLDDPARVVKLATESPPSLVLMDIRMGDFDGIELVRTLRGVDATRDVPMILFSSQHDAATRDAAYAAGADDFLAKPLVPSELRSRIGERLERHRLLRLSAGLHAATGLPLPARTAREAPATLATLVGGSAEVSLAVLRPDTADRFADGVEWLRETRRVADEIGGAFAGYADGLGLLLVTVGGAGELAARLAAIAPPAHSTAAWRAGIATPDTVGDSDFDVLRRAAEDALDGVPRGADARTAIWSRATANLAPDVIIVDDDHALTEMLQFAMRSSGLTNRAFDNGRAALEAILAMHTLGRRPLVLLDVDLPGIDGYTLHERLRVERPGAFQVVFLTVHSAEAEQIRALRAGALDYIVKPLNLRILMAKVPLWVGRMPP